MPIPNTNNFDYVYFSSETGEFENVSVRLEIKDAGMVLNVDSEREINADDIAVLLDGIKDHTLKRLKICYATDTKIMLHVCGKAHEVEYSDDKYTIGNL